MEIVLAWGDSNQGLMDRQEANHALITILLLIVPTRLILIDKSRKLIIEMSDIIEGLG